MPWHQKYPSSNAVLNFFPSFRQAWTAAGFDVDRSWEEWTAMEDWFVLESVGILPRSEVAQILKRSAPAIKRRLYDLGDIRSYNRWGVTLTHAAELMNLSQSCIKKYLDYGIIPFLKGNKLFYLNPADLLKIDEFDWTAKKINTELDQLIRKAVTQRICKMLKFGTKWRDHEVYKFNKTKELYQSRIKNPRKSAFTDKIPDPPNDLKAQDWVVTTAPTKNMRDFGHRIGRIEAVWYSWQSVKRVDGTKRPMWVAKVEYPKIRTITGEKDRRIRYTIPLELLTRTEAPKPEPKPLSMHPEAVRGRTRKAAGEFDRKQQWIRERANDFTAAK